MAAERKPKQHRVFFALWPDEAVLRELDQAAWQAHQGCGGRRMRRDTLHLTLAFIGAISPKRLIDLLGIAGSLRVPRFELALDRFEWVQKRKIVWAGAGLVPEALRELAAGLNSRLEAAGFRTEDRPFAAHVTLLRNARGEPLPALGPVNWPVSEFVLVESDLKPEGANYRIIGRWPLAGGQ